MVPQPPSNPLHTMRTSLTSPNKPLNPLNATAPTNNAPSSRHQSPRNQLPPHPPALHRPRHLQRHTPHPPKTRPTLPILLNPSLNLLPRAEGPRKIIRNLVYRRRTFPHRCSYNTCRTTLTQRSQMAKR